MESHVQGRPRPPLTSTRARLCEATSHESALKMSGGFSKLGSNADVRRAQRGWSEGGAECHREQPGAGGAARTFVGPRATSRSVLGQPASASDRVALLMTAPSALLSAREPAVEISSCAILLPCWPTYRVATQRVALPLLYV